MRQDAEKQASVSEASSVRSTLGLSKRLREGDISPEQYARLRAEKVGAPDFIQGFVVPALLFLGKGQIRLRG